MYAVTSSEWKRGISDKTRKIEETMEKLEASCKVSPESRGSPRTPYKSVAPSGLFRGRGSKSARGGLVSVFAV